MRARSGETSASAGRVPGRSSASSTCSPPSTASPVACASATAWRSVCRASSVSTSPPAIWSAGAHRAARGVRAPLGGEIAVAAVHRLARDAEVAADRGQRRARVERAGDVGALHVVELLAQGRDPLQRGVGIGVASSSATSCSSSALARGGSAGAIIARPPEGRPPWWVGIMGSAPCSSGSRIETRAHRRGWPDAPDGTMPRRPDTAPDPRPGEDVRVRTWSTPPRPGIPAGALHRPGQTSTTPHEPRGRALVLR